jgi:hypothetical protein
MIISNPTRNYLYFNRKNNQILYNLYDLINIDLIRTASLKAHEKNISHFFSRPDQYQEVFSGISLIPPRSRWNYDGNNFRCLNVNIVSSNIRTSKYF